MNNLELCKYFYESKCKPEKCWISRKDILKAKQILKFWGWFTYDKNEEILVVYP